MRPTDFAVVVGIDQYSSLSSLAGAVHDARAMAEWLCAPQGGGVPRENLQLLVSHPDRPGHPTVADVEQSFNQLVERSQSQIQTGQGSRVGRRLYLYFAGHSIQSANNDASILMADASRVTLGRGIPVDGYSRWFQAAGLFDQLIVILDTSQTRHSGITFPPPIFTPIFEPAHPHSWTCSLRVGGGGRLGRPVEDAIEGVFTSALLAGLSGGAADSTGVVTLPSLVDYMNARLHASWPGVPPNEYPTLVWRSDGPSGESFTVTEGNPPPLVRIRTTVPISDCTVRLIGPTLETIETRKPDSSEICFDVPRGLYLLEVTDTNGAVEKQVVVKAMDQEVINVTL